MTRTGTVGPRIGSLCSGYGGLDLAVREVLGGDLAWCADNDPAAGRVLAHHWPRIPNLGDITSAAWTEPPDILTAGFPCQEVSLAGTRAGLREGTRSGVWAHVCRAIGDLRPPLVICENVRGLLSATAAVSNMESCPRCVGNKNGRALRALGAVLGDLAALGYDAEWQVVRASDAAAPHRRERVFILAWPAGGPGRDGPEGKRSGAPADSPGDRGDERQPEPARVLRRPDAVLSGHAAAPDPVGCRRHRRPYPPQRCQGRGAAARGHRAASPDPDGARRAQGQDPAAVRGRARPGPCTAGQGPGSIEPERCRRDRASDIPCRQARRPQAGYRPPAPEDPGGAAGPVPDWGPYRPAIERWERATGRPAPLPTAPGRNGERLSPAFVEWMMGLEAGWVTGVPGLSRSAQLRVLGNGVVPQQAAAALSLLLDRSRAARSTARRDPG